MSKKRAGLIRGDHVRYSKESLMRLQAKRPDHGIVMGIKDGSVLVAPIEGGDHLWIPRNCLVRVPDAHKTRQG